MSKKVDFLKLTECQSTVLLKNKKNLKELFCVTMIGLNDPDCMNDKY